MLDAGLRYCVVADLVIVALFAALTLDEEAGLDTEEGRLVTVEADRAVRFVAPVLTPLRVALPALRIELLPVFPAMLLSVWALMP